MCGYVYVCVCSQITLSCLRFTAMVCELWSRSSISCDFWGCLFAFSKFGLRIIWLNVWNESENEYSQHMKFLLNKSRSNHELGHCSGFRSAFSLGGGGCSQHLVSIYTVASFLIEQSCRWNHHVSCCVGQFCSSKLKCLTNIINLKINLKFCECRWLDLTWFVEA